MLDEKALDAYLKVAQEIPFARSAPLIEKLLQGESIIDAAVSCNCSAGDVARFCSLGDHEGGDPRTVGRNLRKLYVAFKDAARSAEIVWTGPTVIGAESVRATFPVARSLVSSAKERLIIAGYVTQVDVLEKLGLRSAIARGADVLVLMDRVDWDDVDVRTLLAAGAKVIDACPDSGGMAKFHAKVIVADGVKALVTSANLTHLGQARNIELGILLKGDIAGKVGSLLERYAAAVLERTRMVASPP